MLFRTFLLLMAAPFESYVRITTTGATFAPVLELITGSSAIISWEVEGGLTYQGLTPNINFGTAATRHIRLKALNACGRNALGDITTFNIGYERTQDLGQDSLDASYNLGAQDVAALEGVNRMTGLVRFLAANNAGLVGPMDFTGMSNLTHIECYGSSLTSVILAGCSSLIRLCVEDNDIATIDLNPVASTLHDLRVSGNNSPFTFVPLMNPLANLYHFCCQGQITINHPTPAQLPVVEEQWEWNAGLPEGGAVPFAVASNAIRSLRSYGNGWTSVDLTGRFPQSRITDRRGDIQFQNCPNLTSVTLTGCDGLRSIQLQNCALSTSVVDAILAEVNSWGTSSTDYLDTPVLNLAGNAGPSSSANANALTSRGWIVTTEAVVALTAPVIGSSYNTLTVTTATNVSIPYTITDINGGAFTATYTLDGVPTTASGLFVGANTWNVGTLAAGSRTLTIQVADDTGLISNTLTFNITCTSSSALWRDDFNRADVVGVANVGNGWTSFGLGCDIASGDLVLQGTSYGRLANAGGGNLPADYMVTTVFPPNQRKEYYGLLAHYNGTSGIRAMFPGTADNNLTIGNALGWNTGNLTLGTVAYPANWTNDAIEHTMSLKIVGNSIEVILDGQSAVTVTVDPATNPWINSGETGLYFGFCGEGNGGHRPYIEVTAA